MSTVPTPVEHAQKTLADSESDFTAEGAPPPVPVSPAVGGSASPDAAKPSGAQPGSDASS